MRTTEKIHIGHCGKLNPEKFRGKKIKQKDSRALDKAEFRPKASE